MIVFTVPPGEQAICPRIRYVLNVRRLLLMGLWLSLSVQPLTVAAQEPKAQTNAPSLAVPSVQPDAPGNEKERCDLDAVLRQAYELMKARGTPLQILTLLEAARDCPDAQVDPEFLLYHAATLLKSGEISRAAEAARSARRVAIHNEELRSRATRFLELIEQRPEVGPQDKGLVHKVTFQIVDGSKLAASIRITQVAQETLPRDQEWGAAFPKVLEFYAEGTHRNLLQAARRQCQNNEQWPLVIWLPTGRYTFSTGQTVWVNDDMVINPREVRWAQNTPSIRMMAALPMGVGKTRVCGGGLYGPQLEYAWRQKNDLLLTGMVAAYGASETPTETCPNGNGMGAWGSLGLQKPLTVGRDLPLLLGMAAGGMSINLWASHAIQVVPAQDPTVSRHRSDATTPSDADGSFASYGLGLFIQPTARLLLPLPATPLGRGFVSVGGAAAVTLALPVGFEASLPNPAADTAAGASTPLQVTDPEAGLVLMPELQLGASWTF